MIKCSTVRQRVAVAYDADQLRIRKTKSSTGAVTHCIYDPNGQLMAEMDGATGDPIREYIWLGALPIGYVDRLGASGASRLFFIHADHLGRPQKITDGSRAIVWDGVFAPSAKSTPSPAEIRSHASIRMAGSGTTSPARHSVSQSATSSTRTDAIH